MKSRNERAHDMDIRIAQGVAEKLQLHSAQEFYRWLETVSIEEYLRVALPVYESVLSRNYEPHRVRQTEDATSNR